MSEDGLVLLGSQARERREERLAPVMGRDFSGNVCLVTLGCAKNQVDSEIMLGSFVRKGFRPISDPANAEVIVVNTCAFLQSAVEEGIDTILALTEHKKTGRCRRLVVAGCMVERYRQDLQQEFPEVDRFLSTDELLHVADEGATSGQCFDSARRPYFLYDEQMPRVLSSGKHSAYVKIAEGCNRPCSFCIIPKIRGAFRSRAKESVVAEVKELIDCGAKEINFVAQDLTAYGTDFPGNRGLRSELRPLLSELSEVEGDFWIRLLYAYPVGVDETLIRTIVESSKIANYLDLPLQHISHSVLKAMKRPLGERGTRALIEKIREVGPEIALRTTMIVGFPGETEDDVRALEQFVAEGHFMHLGVFMYSQEEEAGSFSLPNQVPQKVKEERRERIMVCQQQVVKKRLAAYLGREVRILCEGTHSESDLLYSGRTEFQAPETDGEVIINAVRDDFVGTLEESTGMFVRGVITEVAGYDLLATVRGLEQGLGLGQGQGQGQGQGIGLGVE